MGEMKLNDFERGFLVGLIEGEGSIGINKSNNRHRGSRDGTRGGRGYTLTSVISIYNKHRHLLSYAQSLVGGSLRASGGKRSIFVLSFTSLVGCLSVLNEISAHLVTSWKRRRAELLLEYVKRRLETIKRFSPKEPYTEEEIELARKVREVPSLRPWQQNKNFDKRFQDHPLDRETLQRLYWDEGLSLRAIARRSGYCKASVAKRMKKLGIPRR